MKTIGITNVRLDLGGPRRGAAAGPAALHDTGLIAALEVLGHRVEAQHEILQDDAKGPGFDPRARYLEVIASACVRLADTVELSLRSGRFPLILGGDHSLAMGSVAGVARHFQHHGKELGVLWVDAHADMNTPHTSPSGNLHGMPLAVLLGHGLDPLTRICGRAPALAPRHVVLFGVRDVDAEEELFMQDSGVRVFKRAEITRRGVDVCMAEATNILHDASAGIHLSFDLDACDPSLAPGVTTPIDGGLDDSEALQICRCVGRSGRLVSAEFVEFNPTTDSENRTRDLIIRLIESALANERHRHHAEPALDGALTCALQLPSTGGLGEPELVRGDPDGAGPTPLTLVRRALR
jgi:arginase